MSRAISPAHGSIFLPRHRLILMNKLERHQRRLCRKVKAHRAAAKKSG